MNTQIPQIPKPKPQAAAPTQPAEISALRALPDAKTARQPAVALDLIVS